MQVYDPHGTGFADNETLRRIFHDLGYGDISDEDLEVPAAEPIPRRMADARTVHLRALPSRRARSQVLIETADADRDGRISLEDFRQMLCSRRSQ